MAIWSHFKKYIHFVCKKQLLLFSIEERVKSVCSNVNRRSENGRCGFSQAQEVHFGQPQVRERLDVLHESSERGDVSNWLIMSFSSTSCSSMTLKILRKHLEEDLGLEADALKPFKKMIGDYVDTVGFVILSPLPQQIP
jgi:hypothetical protein